MINENSIKAYKHLIESGEISLMHRNIIRVFIEQKRPLTVHDTFYQYKRRYFEGRTKPDTLLANIRSRVNELKASKILVEGEKVLCTSSSRTVSQYQLADRVPHIQRPTTLQKLDREINSLQKKLLTKQAKRTELVSEQSKAWDKQEQSRQTGFQL